MNARSAKRIAGSVTLLTLPLLAGGCSLSLSLDPKQGQNAAVARGTTTESSAATLVRLLDSEDAQVRSVAVRGLAEMGESARGAAPALHALVDDPDRHVRYEAAKALAAVNPQDPALPAVLVLIANDQRTPEEQRVEMRTILSRVSPMMATTASRDVTAQTTGHDHDSGIEVVETTETHAPTTRPTGFEITSSSASPTTRPIMASERTEQVNESTSNGAAAVAPPATRPATRPVSQEHTWADINGLSALVDASSQDTPPAPDVNLFGYKSYTSAGAMQVRDWIQRRPSLTLQEKESRIKEFQEWRYAQDKLIYQKVLER
jgi:hypothetical protein